MFDFIATHFNYYVVIILMMTGLYVVFASGNLIKKLVGLSVFQTSVFILYITIGKVAGGKPPIIEKGHGGGDEHHAYNVAANAAPDSSASDAVYAAADHAEALYSNPLPHVLILTAIVVGVATLAVGLALVVRIREVYGTIEDADIDRADYAYNLEGEGC